MKTDNRSLKALLGSLLIAASFFQSSGLLVAAEHQGYVKFGGLPVPGATVTATQGDKKLVAISDLQGAYSFPDLADGVWTMQVEMLCFSPIKQEVAASLSPEWNLKLLTLDEIKAIARPPVSTPAPTQQIVGPA